jgi:hypothetical protein
MQGKALLSVATFHGDCKIDMKLPTDSVWPLNEPDHRRRDLIRSADRPAQPVEWVRTVSTGTH